ncbi:hypothetical protein [Paenibacillus sp. FSL R7-0333]|uniref:hypothetical protein n=1 Tax=Paenibacillus sp. FSL R7-0333 TaxID=1926587 RepID=UPI00096FE49C|nr:hypothetical protein BK146_16790 [Paenibacillus sp. FSL R7-0333]
MLSWEPVGYMLFSTVETFAVYCLIMTLFRYKFQDYIWEALITGLLINLQSYVMRNEFSLAYLVPIITIFIFVALFKVIVKIPLIWSIIVTVLGYVIYALLQTGLANMLFGSIAAIADSKFNGYLLQFSSGGMTIIASLFLYKIGMGFKFNFEKLRFRFEDIIMIAMIIFFLISVSIVFYYNDMFVNIVFFICVMAFLLYYAIRKEQGE